MPIQTTAIPDVLIIEPKVFGDERGFFYESFNARSFAEQTGVTANFVQDNHSKSAKGVLAKFLMWRSIFDNIRRHLVSG